MTRDEIRQIADIIEDDKKYRHFVKRINKEFDLSDASRNSNVFVLFEEEKKEQIGFCVIGQSDSKMKVWEKTFKEEGWVEKDFKMSKSPFELMYMYIKPEKRKNGMGSKLFNKMIDFSKERKVDEIYAYVSDLTTDSMNFYNSTNVSIIKDFSDEDTSVAFLRWNVA